MPSASSVHRTLARKKRSGPTHREVMEKRHAKRRKNEKKNLKSKKMNALNEYQRLSKIEYKSKKTTAMNLMDLIEDIKEKIPDGTYLKMMDELMALNKETESQTPPRIHGDTAYQDDSDEDYIMNYFRDYYFDRVGNRDNINREDNIIREDINIEVVRNTTNRFINNITDSYQRAYPENDNWYRTADGTWRERNPGTPYGVGIRS
jgi:anti-sigma28 factor (negative regulator of flagellin synthesis)|tara:strand:- start:300 stop:914 length:615 start_codon:yes stop_codon:yes gene_type:complete